MLYYNRKELCIHMTLTYRSMSDKYLDSSLELVRTVFTEHENAEEGKLVRALVEEIRSRLPTFPNLS